jgi:hypothetical protein
MSNDDLRRFDGHIIEALKMVPHTKWSLLFRNLRDFYQNQISGCPNESLVELKAKILAVQEIEQLFTINRDLAPEK